MIPEGMQVNGESPVEVIDAASDQLTTWSADHASQATGQFVTFGQGQAVAQANGQYSTESTGLCQTPLQASGQFPSGDHGQRVYQANQQAHTYKVGPLWGNTASLCISSQASSKLWDNTSRDMLLTHKETIF